MRKRKAFLLTAASLLFLIACTKKEENISRDVIQEKTNSNSEKNKDKYKNSTVF